MLFHLQKGQVSECTSSGCLRLLKSYKPRSRCEDFFRSYQLGRVTPAKWIVKTLKPFISTVERVTYFTSSFRKKKTYPGSIYHQQGQLSISASIPYIMYTLNTYSSCFIFLDIFDLKNMVLLSLTKHCSIPIASVKVLKRWSQRVEVYKVPSHS